MRNKYIYITLLSALVLANEAGAQTVPQAPKLVVSITVDELRTDHLETFAPLYNAYGLRRMLTECPQAPHPTIMVSRAKNGSTAARCALFVLSSTSAKAILPDSWAHQPLAMS